VRKVGSQNDEGQATGKQVNDVFKLLEKLRFEIADYEQDYRLCPKPDYKLSDDERYLFFLEVLDFCSETRFSHRIVSALCSVDGLLMVCWDIWYEYECPIKTVLLKAAASARNGVV